MFRHEATVGAGLPVISTVRDPIDTGDAVLAIEGILSGTLAWVCHRYHGTMPFGERVRQARDRGIPKTEPRDDLCGLAEARTIVLRAREVGWSLSLDQVRVESRLPTALRELSRDEFRQRLDEMDAPFATRDEVARAAGHVLRYVAHRAYDGRACVGLVALPTGHAFAHTALTDNIVLFRTRRYADNPLIVRHPGAGTGVTAAGAFAGVLRVAASPGARV